MPDEPVVPPVSVVIPARDAGTMLRRAVESALSQDGVIEIAVAHAPSSDGTEQVIADLHARDERVVAVPNPAGTTPAGLNAAVAATTGDVIVRLDAHAVLPPGYVATAVAALDATGAGNVGGRQVPTAEDGFAAAVASAMASPLGSGGATYRSGSTAAAVETVYLGVFRRAALEDVGGFDERLVRNQDYELNHRLRKAGWTVWFDPSLAVAYTPRGSVRALARQYLDYGRYKRLVARMHPSSLRPRQLAPVAMVAGVLGAGAAGIVMSTPWIPAVAVGGYLAAVAAGAVAADPRRAPAVAVALATMHWSWAAGFLLGPPRTDG